MGSLPSQWLGVGGLAIAWALVVGFGLTRLVQYALTPAEAASPAATWPASSRLVRQPDRLTLVMVAHPQCPCTRASLGELEVIAARTAKLLDIHVVFLRSDAFASESDLWRQAKAIPGVQVSADPSGVEIGKFEVTASGHTLVYDKLGRLRFSGGITASRGHAGGNLGRDVVIELAQSGQTKTRGSPVFGCALSDAAKRSVP